MLVSWEEGFSNFISLSFPLCKHYRPFLFSASLSIYTMCRKDVSYNVFIPLSLSCMDVDTHINIPEFFFSSVLVQSHL